MGLKNPERERFLLAFGYVFPDPSPSMGVKCWRRIAEGLPDGVRYVLIEALWNIAKAKAAARGNDVDGEETR